LKIINEKTENDDWIYSQKIFKNRLFDLMKTLIYIILISVVMISCTENIDIDINAAHPQLVVEAGIGLNEPARVVLTRSISLDESITLPFETNADVQITDNFGKTEKLSEISPGVYMSTLLLGTEGNTYQLSVKTKDETVTANSTMPVKVKIDTVTVVNSIYPGGGPPQGNQPAPFYEVRVKFTDPSERTNYYRFLSYVNGEIVNRNSILNDRLVNGNVVESLLIIYNPDLSAGDLITIEMQSIEKPVFEYFSSINSMGGPNSSSPANPYTNLNGAILGYFSAHTVERINYVLK
jgi:hypothetical protein